MQKIICSFRCFLTNESKKQLQQFLSKSSIYCILNFFNSHLINMNDPVLSITQGM